MIVRDSEKVMECRYSDYIPAEILNAELVKDESEASYSGQVNITYMKDGQLWKLTYTYGSCSGCDNWESENLSSEQITKEINDLAFPVR